MALLEFAPIITRMLEAARPPDPGSRRLLHMSFANYAAGAIIMPYGKFLRAAEEHRYAIDRLCAHFASNVEQVAHRLTTMSRSGSKGIPFFMLPRRSRREHLQALRRRELPLLPLRRNLPPLAFARGVPDAGPDHPPAHRDPDGQRFFTISRTIERPDPARPQRRCPAGDRAGLRRQATRAASPMPMDWT